MKVRISKSVMSVPGVMGALLALRTAGARGDLRPETTQLVLLRASSPRQRAAMISSRGRGGTGLRRTAHRSRRKP
jgi:hypothetical protein